MPAEHDIHLVVVIVSGGAESVMFVTIILLATVESPTKTAVAAEVVVETTNILSVRMDR